MLAQPQLTVENLSGAPFNDRVVLSRIGSLAAPPAGYAFHEQSQIRLRNTGTANLQITGLTNTGQFQLVSPPALPATIAPGNNITLTIRYIAQSGNLSGGQRGLHSGTLTITNNSPQPSVAVQLSGYWQAIPEGGIEPRLSELVEQIFGYGTDVLFAGQSINNQGRIEAVGEEVLSPYWKRANTTLPVTVQQLAAYHTPNAARIFWHPKGNLNATQVKRHAEPYQQSVLPHNFNDPSVTTPGSFTPGAQVFGFRVDGTEWSDPALNDSSPDDCSGGPNTCGQHIRFWPAKDRSGVVIPATYIMGMDYSGINYDFNDNVYLISNITPEVSSQPPVASFTATPSQGPAPLAVGFDASGSTDDGSITQYAWDFGDATTGSGVMTNHTYPTIGFYTVTLTVTDNNNLTATTTRLINATATGAFAESDGQVVNDAENFHSMLFRNNHEWTLVTPPGSVGAAVEATPNDGTSINTGYAGTSPELQYQIDFTSTGTYYVWARVLGPTFDDDSFHAGLDGQTPATADRIKSGTQGSWVWTNTTMDNESRATLSVGTAGLHTLNVWMREDGLQIDRLLLTKDPGFVPMGNGPAESPRVGGTGPQVVAEAGMITMSQSDPTQWHTVTLTHTFTSPVVVMGPFSYNGGEPSTVRVRNVTPTAFEFQLDEWDYLNGIHTSETVSYLVVEAGTHTLDGGHVLQAGLASIGANPSTATFPQSFSGTPAVVSQAVTTNNAAAVVTRQQNVGTGSFQVFLQRQEANSNPANETVAWIAQQTGAGLAGSQLYEAAISADAVTHGFFSLSFGQSFTQAPAFVAAMQTTDGSDPATLRYQSLTTSGVQVKVEEEQSADSETNHTTERVGYLAFTPGLIQGTTGQTLAQIAATQTGLAISEGLDAPGDYALHENYPNPFNPTTTIRYEVPEQVRVRLDVFDVMGRRIAQLVDATQPAGRYETTFEASALPSGVYFYRLQAGSFTHTAKMILLK